MLFRSALYLGAFLHGLQAAFIERDVQGFFLRDCHGSRRVTFGLPYPLSPGIDDLALSTLFEIAVKQGQGGRVFQRFRRRVAALFQSHDDMLARNALGVQPEVLAFGEPERQFIVLAGVPSDKNMVAVR